MELVKMYLWNAVMERTKQDHTRHLDVEEMRIVNRVGAIVDVESCYRILRHR